MTKRQSMNQNKSSEVELNDPNNEEILNEATEIDIQTDIINGEEV